MSGDKGKCSMEKLLGNVRVFFPFFNPSVLKFISVILEKGFKFK